MAISSNRTYEFQLKNRSSKYLAVPISIISMGCLCLILYFKCIDPIFYFTGAEYKGLITAYLIIGRGSGTGGLMWQQPHPGYITKIFLSRSVIISPIHFIKSILNGTVRKFCKFEVKFVHFG
jgi:hypothetical protein